MSETPEQSGLTSATMETDLNFAGSETSTTPIVNQEADTSAVKVSDSVNAPGSSAIFSENVNHLGSDNQKCTMAVHQEQTDASSNVLTVTSETLNSEKIKPTIDETVEPPAPKTVEEFQSNLEDNQAAHKPPFAPGSEALDDEGMKLEVQTSQLGESGHVSLGHSTSCEMSVKAPTLPSPDTLLEPIEMNSQSATGVGSEKTKAEEIIQHENADVKATEAEPFVAVCPPPVTANELAEGRNDEVNQTTMERANTTVTQSDESVLSVVQNGAPNSLCPSGTPLPEEEHTEMDKLPDTITEPIMHVIDPCTEVPEPVGTPQTSRSKISESRGGDNGPELNVAHLVDAIDIREATEEDIPPLQPVTPEATHHVERPRRPPPPVIMTAAHGISPNAAANKKSHGGFHFRLGHSKSRDNSATREDSLDHHQRRTIGASVRSAFGTLTRSIKRKQSDLSDKKRASADSSADGRLTRPPPPRRDQFQLAVQPKTHMDQEEQSLQSVSGVCLSQESSIHGSPGQKRRQLVLSAANDIQQALSADDHMTEVSPIYVNHSMQSKMDSGEQNISPPEVVISLNGKVDRSKDKDRVLSWTAASIANTNYETAVEEDQIRPVHVERGRSQQVFLSRLVTDNGDTVESVPPTTVRSPRVISAGNSPKPPRPISRPVLSPLDYQTFHSEDSLSQPEVARRVDLTQAVAPVSVEVSMPTGVPYEVDHEQIVRQDSGPYKVSASLDRRQYDTIERSSTNDARRAQTMRTADYAGRLRERLRTFRGDSSDGFEERGGTLRVTKVRSKPENYVCSETIHWPGKLLKLKRRQTTPPAKHVYSTPNEVVIPRPQPRTAMSYHPGSSPLSPRSPLHESVSVTQTIHVQSKPPRSAPAQRMEIQAHMSPESPARQLTNLQSLARASPKTQRCTALPESPQRGLMQLADADIDLPTQVYNVTTFPYLSKELTVQITQSDKEPQVDAQTLSTYTEGQLIDVGLEHIHPFLAKRAEDSVSAMNEEAESKESTECAKMTMKNFLNTCVRLKSVDLQGHYAAFHYPLHAFNPDLWRSNARFTEWDNLAVVQEPGYITRYVELSPPSPQFDTFLYADRPIDVLLTSWLDCHQTTPPSETYSQSIEKPAHIYHPISFAARLDQLLSHTEAKEDERLANTCFRLAVLLTYAHCCRCLTRWNHPLHIITTDPRDILVILSTCNCLILFKKNTAHASTDDELSTTNTLVKSLCHSEVTLEQGIDNLVRKIDEELTRDFGKINYSSRWLEAVAPPDWIALCCSRIYLKQK